MRFGELQIGEIFRYNGHLFTKELRIIGRVKTNAVRHYDKEAYFFSPKHEVVSLREEGQNAIQ